RLHEPGPRRLSLPGLRPPPLRPASLPRPTRDPRSLDRGSRSSPPWGYPARMDPRLTLVTLGVADLDRAVGFYRDVVGWTPASVLDDVAFFDLDGTVLALWLHGPLAAELGVEPVVPAYRTVALAHNLASPEAVDATIAELRARGA